MACRKYLNTLDEMGTSATRKQCHAAANLILARPHSSNPGPPPTTGIHWVTRFLERHSEYYIRTQRPINIDRQISQDPDNIRRWYERLGQLISEKGITAHNIYNFAPVIGPNNWSLIGL